MGVASHAHRSVRQDIRDSFLQRGSMTSNFSNCQMISPTCSLLETNTTRKIAQAKDDQHSQHTVIPRLFPSHTNCDNRIDLRQQCDSSPEPVAQLEKRTRTVDSQSISRGMNRRRSRPFSTSGVTKRSAMRVANIVEHPRPLETPDPSL